MSLKLYEETDIQSIANSIRDKNGTTNTYKVSEMSSAIDAIETGSGSSSARLPSEYQEVEYIESTGTQYIDTLYTPNINTKLTIDFMDTAANNYENYFGCDNAWRFQRQGKNATNFVWLVNNTQSTFALDLTTRKKLTFTKNGIFDEEGNSILSKVIDTISTTYTMLIFQGIYGNKLDTYGSYRLYSLDIYEGEELKRQFIPCYRLADEVVGLYDLANNVFYENQGTGEFVKGNPTIPTIEITEDGMHTITGYDLADVKVLDSLTETLKITNDGIYDVKNYAKTEVSVSSGDWMPEEDWWDIDSILENDTEDYPAKIIFLLNNSYDTTNFQSLNSTKIVCSDGTVYNPNNSAVWYEHSWDTTKDKECSLGYKTRYIIFYYSGTSVTLGTNSTVWGNSYGSSNQFLYGIVNGFTSFSSPSIINGCSNIQMMKYINTKNTSTNLNISNCGKLINLIGYVNDNLTNIYGGNTNKFVGFNYIDLSKVTTIQNMYQSNNSINKIVYPSTLDLSKIKSYYGTFNNFTGNVIEKIDFTSCTSTANIMNTAPNIISIIEILGQLKVSTNIGQATGLNHDTLIRFINCLYDYAAEGSTNTYTLTLGPTLLAKLTDEEKAIATNKGWTLN